MNLFVSLRSHAVTDVFSVQTVCVALDRDEISGEGASFWGSVWRASLESSFSSDGQVRLIGPQL